MSLILNSLTGYCCIVFLSACGTSSRSQNTQKSESASIPKAAPSAHGPTSTSIPANATLEDLVRYALANSQEIVAAEAKVRRLLAKVPQARSLPDPMAKISAGSMAETAAGQVVATGGIEQKLPYPGKLRSMAAAAGKEAEAAAAELEDTQQAVAADVRTAYWNYYAASQTKAITTETRTALNQIRDSVDAQVAAGAATQDDQLRLATEFGKIEKALVESAQAEASAKARLNSLLNRKSGSSLPAPKASGAGSRGELSSLLSKAERDHPSVRAAQAQLEAFEHRLERAKLERYPDFTVGLSHAAVTDSGIAPSANGRDQIFATLGITIPFWEAPKRAMVDEALAGIDESEAKIGAIRSRLRYRVEDAWLRAKSSEQLITLFDKQILPESKQAFDVVLAGYAAGTQSFVDVLDAWRSLLGFQLQQATNRASYGQAIATLRQATGG